MAQIKHEWEREVISSTHLTQDDLRRLNSVFQFFDTDSDGFLSSEQVALAVVHTGLRDCPAVVTLTDYPAFCRYVGACQSKLYQSGTLDGKIRLAYQLLDKEQANSIDDATLARHLKSVGLAVSQEHVTRITELICSRQSSTFSEADFLRFMKKNAADM